MENINVGFLLLGLGVLGVIGLFLILILIYLIGVYKANQSDGMGGCSSTIAVIGLLFCLVGLIPIGIPIIILGAAISCSDFRRYPRPTGTLITGEEEEPDWVNASHRGYGPEHDP